MEKEIKTLINNAKDKVKELNKIFEELSKHEVDTYGKITAFGKDGISPHGTPRLALFCKKVDFIEEL